jgi:uncharacterized protein
MHAASLPMNHEKNADPYRENHHRQSPLGLARLIANNDVAKYFDDFPK